MKIVHVDDSRFSLKIATNFLKQIFREAEIVSLNDEEEFLKFLEESKLDDIDIFIIDLLLPKISGEELVKQIKKKYPNVFVAVLSSNVQSNVKEKLYDCGIDLFIEKPLTLDKLRDMEVCYNEKRNRRV